VTRRGSAGRTTIGVKKKLFAKEVWGESRHLARFSRRSLTPSPLSWWWDSGQAPHTLCRLIRLFVPDSLEKDPDLWKARRDMFVARGLGLDPLSQSFPVKVKNGGTMDC
jgi:hypothetical protein